MDKITEFKTKQVMKVVDFDTLIEEDKLLQNILKITANIRNAHESSRSA